MFCKDITVLKRILTASKSLVDKYENMLVYFSSSQDFLIIDKFVDLIQKEIKKQRFIQNKINNL